MAKKTFTCKNEMEAWWEMLECVQEYIDNLNENDRLSKIKAWNVSVMPIRSKK
jgi:hypothetical protein